MKKGLLILPLFAISSLIGCKENGYKVIVPNIDGVSFSSLTITPGSDYSTNITVDAKLSNKILPFEMRNVRIGETLHKCTYIPNSDYMSAKLTVDKELINGDITIDFSLLDRPWYMDRSYINSLKQEDVNKKGGVIKTLKVNGFAHKVRLIGVAEDYEDDEHKSKPIHTTWEFVNSISDYTGHSLAVQWNDTNNWRASSNDYYNSTIRKALNGAGDASHLLWAEWTEEKETGWSDNYTSSVLDMIDEGNPGFKDVLKAPSKFVNINDGGWKEKTINDKLFLLSPAEMGFVNRDYQEPSTSTYTYYSGHTEKTDIIRIKKQFSEAEVFESLNHSNIPIGSGQSYGHKDVLNYAGVNEKDDYTGGGRAWLRSPYTQYEGNSWAIDPVGLLDFFNTYDRAFAVAPAFCI